MNYLKLISVVAFVLSGLIMAFIFVLLKDAFYNRAMIQAMIYLFCCCMSIGFFLRLLWGKMDRDD